MRADGEFSAGRAFRRGEVVRGEPYVVGGRTLVPLARIRAFEGLGGRFRSRTVEPLGVIEELAGVRRLIPLRGGQAARAARLVGIALPVLLFVVVGIAVRARREGRLAQRR